MENGKKSRNWIIPTIIAAVLTLGGGSATLIRSDARLEERTTTNTISIQRLEDQKADKEVVKRVDEALIRIEEKLDNYILEDKN